MKKGTKRSPIDKQTLQRQQKLAQDRRFIEKEFFPALKEATVSIDEAKMLLAASASLIMEEAMEALRTTSVKKVRSRLISKLAPDGERQVQIEKLVDLFAAKSLFETRGHLEMMKAVIEKMELDEMRERSLDTLKFDWDKVLNG